jgi:hypothetical protein
MTGRFAEKDTESIMQKHEPVVVERLLFAISKSECSCGAKLPLGEIVGSPNQQHKKLKEAFRVHTTERAQVCKGRARVKAPHNPC